MLLLVLASEPRNREFVILPLTVPTTLDNVEDMDDNAALFKMKIYDDWLVSVFMCHSQSKHTSNTLMRLSQSISPNIKASAKPISDVKHIRSQKVSLRTVMVALTFEAVFFSEDSGNV